jgi:hypothetical protein
MAELPTRRAFRPDSQYYRTTRRQSLRRRARHEMNRAMAVLPALAIGAVFFYWGWHGGAWGHVIGYGAATAAVLAAVVIGARR